MAYFNSDRHITLGHVCHVCKHFLWATGGNHSTKGGRQPVSGYGGNLLSSALEVQAWPRIPSSCENLMEINHSDRRRGFEAAQEGEVMDKWEQWVYELVDFAHACPSAGLSRGLEAETMTFAASVVMDDYLLHPRFSSHANVFARSQIVGKEDEVAPYSRRLKWLMLLLMWIIVKLADTVELVKAEMMQLLPLKLVVVQNELIPTCICNQIKFQDIIQDSILKNI